MADQNQAIEREYIIPLRKKFLKVVRYERTGRAIKIIKQFIAKHMKVPDRDVSKVKLDVYLNNELWFRGRAHPPSKIKVKAVKTGDIVKVDFVDVPEHVKFAKEKHDKKNKPAEKKEVKKEKVEEKQEEKVEDKKEEKEKEQAVAELREKDAKQDAKAQKHLFKKQEPKINRMALKK